jgi:tetratricopeptide (TPR) repeat protein
MRQPTTISHSRNGNSGGMADRMAPAASIAADGREDELEVRDGFSLGDDDLEAFPTTNDAPADAVRNESVAGTISREEHEFQRRRGVIPSPIAQEGSASAVRGIREDTSSVREHNDSLASMEINSLEELSLELSDNANEELARMRERVAPAVAPQSAKPSTPPFWSGRYAEFRALLDKSDLKAAGNFAQQWHQDDLADMMALIALGEWYEKNNQVDQAIRAYGSLIDYFPGRAEIRRWVAERLLPLNHPDAQWLCVNALEKALAQRADHPSGHYLLAIAYWQVKLYRQAVMILQTAKDMSFPRFPEANRILRETFALMLTTLQQQGQLTTLFPTQTFVWEKAEQQQIRFVLMWETDANDVDLHVYDNQQNHAYYGERSLPTGGTLYADITTGFGPECFQIPEPKAFPYKIQAHYYNMGPMGYGMGMVHILRYQPLKGISSESRPFVVMQNRAFVDLGEVTY